MNTFKDIKVAIIEDDEDFRIAFEAFCLSSKRLDCVFAVDSTEKFIKYYSKNLALDIAVVDISLPGVSGLEAIKFMKKLSPQTEIVVLTVHQDYETTFKAIQKGAMGFLVKKLTFEEIEEHLIEMKDEGKIPLSPQIARRILRYFQPQIKQTKLEDASVQLTPKETIVVKYFVAGKTYKEAAELMEISENGVRYHIKNIYKKLHIKSKSELINLYMGGFFNKMFMMM